MAVRHPDVRPTADLLKGQTARPILGDAGRQDHDSNDLRERIAGSNAEAVLPSRRNRKTAFPHDDEVCKQRDQIERCFGRMKHFRHCPTRYDRLTIHLKGFVRLAAAMIWLR